MNDPNLAANERPESGTHIDSLAEPEPIVRPCLASDIATITDQEPNGSTYAQTTFDAQERGRCLYLIAWLDGTPVGSGEVEWSTIPELKNLHVSPDLRSKGIGTALIAAAEAAATVDHTTISVGVGVDNPHARRLYERLGYTATGRFETYSYTYVAPDGDERTAIETAEYLNKRLHA